MRILITGAGGMLGTDAGRIFADAGHDVIRAQRQEAKGDSVIPLDITDADRVREVILSLRPDVVLHAAAYTNVDGCERDPETAFRVNATGTRSVAEAAEAAGAALVAISTDFVFDGKKASPYVEDDPTNPLGHYGASKLAGEVAALECCARTYVVRTSWLYGVHGRNFPFTMVDLARKFRELSVVADQIGTPTYTVDLAAAIAEIIRVPQYGIYHASNAGETSWYEFARAVLARTGLADVPVHPLTSAEYADKFGSPTERPAYSVLQNRALELRGVSSMRHWAKALDDFIVEAKAVGKI